ncbi:MAG: peptide chain release factor N(5)-glutamine methyltransferase [Bacteroidetes bacterium]|nr:peptide chain release factor N(5)-glutamine methyltransferase [Bacteroidota bacterium]
MTISEFSAFVKHTLSGLYDKGEANALLKNLLQERLSMSFFELAAIENNVLSVNQEAQLLSDLNRLKSGEPLQYILGYTWFNEMKILVDKNVLIPRPETEELISFILDQHFPPNAIMLDLCSGSGCIALSLKSAFPNGEVFGFDVSEGSLKVAEQNSEALKLKVSWKKWDVINESCPHTFHTAPELIVSNPPYITMKEFDDMHKNVTDFEPHLALFVSDADPLIFYTVISKFAKRKLADGGRLWFEVNKWHAVEVAEVMEQNGFDDVRIYRDFSSNDRFVSAVNL